MSMSRLRRGLALPRAAVTFAIGLAFAPLVLEAQTPQTPPTSQPQAPKTGAPEAKGPQPALPSARSILDKHIAAIGGKAAVLGHSSSRATGTFSVAASGMTGALEVAASKPDKSIVRITIPGVGEILEGYDGKNGWTVNPMTGPMLLQGKQLEDKRFDNDFYSELHDDSRYESITTVERTDFDGRPCYKIRLVRKTGGEDFEFYDVETGLKAGRIATRESPMGQITATMVEADYKKFGNLLVPTVMKQSLMGTQQVITITTIEFDKVQPSAFEPPAEIKALIK